MKRSPLCLACAMERIQEMEVPSFVRLAAGIGLSLSALRPPPSALCAACGQLSPIVAAEETEDEPDREPVRREERLYTELAPWSKGELTFRPQRLSRVDSITALEKAQVEGIHIGTMAAGMFPFTVRVGEELRIRVANASNTAGEVGVRLYLTELSS